jgi:hypothetical protein
LLHVLFRFLRNPTRTSARVAPSSEIRRSSRRSALVAASDERSLAAPAFLKRRLSFHVVHALRFGVKRTANAFETIEPFVGSRLFLASCLLPSLSRINAFDDGEDVPDRSSDRPEFHHVER